MKRWLVPIAIIFSSSDSSVKLSRNLEYIGECAFDFCSSLTSIVIPPSCTEIANEAFRGCERLITLHVPQYTQLGNGVIGNTALIKASSFEVDEEGEYDASISENVNNWIKNMNVNEDNQFALHRACSSCTPITDVLFQIVKRQGLISLKKKNEIGFTPLEYLAGNPFAKHIDQRSVVNRYVLEMMGEIV